MLNKRKHERVLKTIALDDDLRRIHKKEDKKLLAKIFGYSALVPHTD